MGIRDLRIVEDYYFLKFLLWGIIKDCEKMLRDFLGLEMFFGIRDWWRIRDWEFKDCRKFFFFIVRDY